MIWSISPSSSKGIEAIRAHISIKITKEENNCIFKPNTESKKKIKPR